MERERANGKVRRTIFGAPHRAQPASEVQSSDFRHRNKYGMMKGLKGKLGAFTTDLNRKRGVKLDCLSFVQLHYNSGRKVDKFVRSLQRAMTEMKES